MAAVVDSVLGLPLIVVFHLDWHSKNMDRMGVAELESSAGIRSAASECFLVRKAKMDVVGPIQLVPQDIALVHARVVDHMWVDLHVQDYHMTCLLAQTDQPLAVQLEDQKPYFAVFERHLFVAEEQNTNHQWNCFLG